ncbi:hypothetical protein S40285_04900 [Stachybotrys chlorohalonatus IBT 40285]|uniref:LPXTG-domain-containing protein n=1 Tax=Stachybotrys chlorohalonatus (strain IBT 40285) TaxID=1283841 RepID=A0A084QGY7_STAC4|nr:hypothetical protein S40285_04900 [Stachybotrys chlorohalonata IBT 40285]
MVADRKAVVVLGLALLRLVAALQVAPNSPCASFCADFSNLDMSNPNSSTTTPNDISCDDDEYSSPEGMKFQRCLTCLENSEFTQDEESDQEWYLYNLRYSFNYCVFGYPNATDVGSSPCITSEACGPLEDALRDGILDPDGADPYAYCEGHGGSSLGDSFSRCLSCVHAGGTHAFLSNFLVALEAGCRQQPADGVVIGLNDTVFTLTSIEIVDPNHIPEAAAGVGSSLSTGVIVGIAIGAVVFLFLAVGCAYMQIRKRRNRAAARRRSNEGPLASPMSFRCRTRLTPLDAEFPADAHRGASEKLYADPGAALSSNPIAGRTQQRPSSARLSSITTTIPQPPPALYSPQRASPDDYTTPTSTTSTRSNAPLLQHRPYVPSDYAESPPLNSVPVFTSGLAVPSPHVHSPANGRFGSFTEQVEMSPVSPWDGSGGYGRDITSGRKSPGGMGTPIEMPIQKSFPPPPRK